MADVLLNSDAIPSGDTHAVAVVACDGSEMESVPSTGKLSTAVEPTPLTVLRTAVENLLQETTREDQALEYLRDVCHETLSVTEHADTTTTGRRTVSRQGSVESETEASDSKEGGKNGSSKSPHQRFRVLGVSKTEKNKARIAKKSSRRTSGNEVPRWRKPETNEPVITDLAIIFTGDALPEGFTKIERSPSGQRADLNKGGGGVFIYLCVSRVHRTEKRPISEILAIYPERGEFVPPGYEVVHRRGAPANLNTGTQGERIYLCFRRSSNTAIVGVSILFPRKGDKAPYGYLKVDRTPDGHEADLNATTGGTEVCICYKKKLMHLSALHQHWLQEFSDHTCASSPVGPANNEGSSGGQNETALAVSADNSRTAELLMYPLLLACYTRHDGAASLAIQGLSKCLDTGLFGGCLFESKLCPLRTVIEAVVSVCHQGIKARFAVVLPFIRKMIRLSSSAFDPFILHKTLKSLIFIGDFNSSLVKPVESELVEKIMNRFETECTKNQANRDHQTQSSSVPSAQSVSHEIIIDLVDAVSEGAEIAKKTENLFGIFKSHSSVHSANFCFSLVEGMDCILTSMAEKNAYQLVITLTKSVRSISAHREKCPDREHSSVVNSLRALNGALLAAGPNTRQHRAFGQMIRRFVVTTANSVALVWSSNVFRANLTLISTLWNHYRRYLKIEFALLFEHLVLRILRSNFAGSITYQLDIMDEIGPWFQLPHNIVDMFLNFDMDRIQQWKIFEHLCSTLCSLAEGNSSPPGVGDGGIDSPIHLQVQAISSILAIARSVMDTSGHAHLINRDARMRHLSMEHGGWEQDDAEDEGNQAPEALLKTESSSISQSRDDEESSTSTESKSPSRVKSTSHGKHGNTSLRMRNELQKQNQQLLKRAMEIAAAKSLKKAIEFLVAMNFIKETPRDITSFLRIYHDVFDETEIGDYLGEGDEDFKVQVRLTYIRAVSFKGMSLVASLRHFLTNGGFRLPGEAQKIERMVEAFAQCYWDDSPSSFSSADTAMIIAYSTIMLNTDLHNPNVKKNKMSKEQFVRNNRGIDNGNDVPRKFLEDIYDDIALRPMHIRGSSVVPKSGETSLSLLDQDVKKFRSSVSKSVMQSEELMKDLSQSYYTFNFVGVDTGISPDLIKLLFERIWFHLLALSTSILCDAQSDLSLTLHCLDLLRYCISTCLFLGMPIERRAFCNLLAKVQGILEEKTSHASNDVNGSINENGTASGSAVAVDWMKRIEEAAANDDPWGSMGDIHLLVNSMKEAIQNQQQSEVLHSVIKRINRGHYFLKDTTHFILEGDLTKKCRSRNQMYRFFLFNDQLLYADKGISGYWNPHNSLRLKLTRISDIPETMMSKHAFQIMNPIKSFTVFAESAHSKSEWMRLLTDAIAEATKKVALNSKRLSYRECTLSQFIEPVPAPVSPSTPAVSVGFSPSSAMKNLMRRSSWVASSISDKDIGSKIELLPQANHATGISPSFMTGKSDTTPGTLGSQLDLEPSLAGSVAPPSPSHLHLFGRHSSPAVPTDIENFELNGGDEDSAPSCSKTTASAATCVLECRNAEPASREPITTRNEE